MDELAWKKDSPRPNAFEKLSEISLKFVQANVNSDTNILHDPTPQTFNMEQLLEETKALEERKGIGTLAMENLKMLSKNINSISCQNATTNTIEEDWKSHFPRFITHWDESQDCTDQDWADQGWVEQDWVNASACQEEWLKLNEKESCLNSLNEGPEATLDFLSCDPSEESDRSANDEWEEILNSWLVPSCLGTSTHERMSYRPAGDLESNEAAKSWAEKFMKVRYLGKDVEAISSDMDQYLRHWSNNYLKICCGEKTEFSDWITKTLDSIDSSKSYEIYQFESPWFTMEAAAALSEGIANFKQGDVANAVLFLESAVLTDKGNSMIWYYLGLANAANGNDAQAIAALKGCLKLDPCYTSAYPALASSLINEGLTSCAAQSICLWIYLDSFSSHVDSSRIKNEKFGFFDLSLMPTSIAREEDLNSLVGLFLDVSQLKDDADVDNKDCKELKSEKASPIVPDHEFHTCLGLLYKMLHDREGAAKNFRIAAETIKYDASSWNRLGVVLIELDHHKDAMDAFREALKLWPGYVRARQNIASCCFKMEIYEEAAKHYLTVLTLQGRVKVWEKKAREESEKLAKQDGDQTCREIRETSAQRATWSLLESVLEKLGREDLMTACGQKNFILLNHLLES